MILFSATILIITGTFFTPAVAAMLIPNAKLVMLSQQSYVEYVTANGTVEEKSAKNISVDYPVVPKTVYYSEGDSIKKGDVLADIDVEQTIQLIAAAYKTDSDSVPKKLASALANADDSEDLSEAEALIPQNIISTASGKINSLEISEGDLCAAGTVASVSDENNLCVSLQINESDISNVSKGQSVTITGAGFSGKSYKGTVTKIASAAKKQLSSTSQETVVDVAASIDNADKSLKVGFTVTGSIAVSEEKSVGVLPYEAVLQDDDGNEFVYVYKNGRAYKQTVSTAEELKGGVVITGGVTGSDFIIYKAEGLDKDVEHVNVTVDSVRSD